MMDHELQSVVDHREIPLEVSEHNVPRTDGGRDAWLVLLSSFALGALVWGFPYSYGVFQEYYLRHEKFSGNPSGVAAIGTTATGIMYLIAPFLYSLFHRYHTHRRIISTIGFILMLASLIGASFSNTVYLLLATQGILYGIGGALLYFPVFNYVDEWFIKRRGFAYGALIAGDGAGGVVIPFVMEWILNKWGFRTALHTWTIICLFLISPALYFLKSRSDKNEAEPISRKLDLRFLKSPAFWVLQSGNLIQSLGYFMPILYMPSFAVACGWSPFTGTVAVSLCNAAIVLGATLVGWLSDRVHVTVAINYCTIGTVLSVFIFWTFSVYHPVLYIFALSYGFFAGGFPATWAGCSNPVRRSYPVETGMIIALFTAGKGVSSIISGPLSSILVTSDTWRAHARYALGSGYGYMIVFSGITASFASMGWIGKKCGWVQ